MLKGAEALYISCRRLNAATDGKLAGKVKTVVSYAQPHTTSGAKPGHTELL